MLLIFSCGVVLGVCVGFGVRAVGVLLLRPVVGLLALLLVVDGGAVLLIISGGVVLGVGVGVRGVGILLPLCWKPRWP